MRRFENTELTALAAMIANLSGIPVQLIENENGIMCITMEDESLAGSLPEICKWATEKARDAEPPMPLMG